MAVSPRKSARAEAPVVTDQASGEMHHHLALRRARAPITTHQTYCVSSTIEESWMVGCQARGLLRRGCTVRLDGACGKAAAGNRARCSTSIDQVLSIVALVA